MRILLAASDRDLLRSFQKLLSEAFGECVTAFDGAQALSALAAAHERPDLAVLDHDLPRVQVPDILRQLNQKHLPSIVLLDGPVTAHQLTEEPLPCAFLSHPFSPDTLTALIQKVASRALADESFSAGGITVEIASFRLKNGPRLSLTEIDLLEQLARKASSGKLPGAAASDFASENTALAAENAEPDTGEASTAVLPTGPEFSGIGAAVSALNEKFRRLGAPARIRYRPKKGFELVADDD